MQFAKETVKAVIASRLGWRASAFARSRGVVVLTYHRVGRPDDVLPSFDVRAFREQMRWVKDRCRVIAPGELREAAQREEERPAVLVTFDDGYRSYYDHAYPVLREFGIPCALFLATSFMDHGGLMWVDALELAVLRSLRDQIVAPWGEEVRLGTHAERARFLVSAKERLKEVPNAERLEALDRLLTDLGATEPVERQMLTWDEVRRTRDLTTLGGHTHSHPILSRLEPSRQADEIRLCRDRIAAELGSAPALFAYPNGRACDFDLTTRTALRDHGFDTAFATEEGINGRDTDWLAVQRMPPGRTVPELAWIVSGLWNRGAVA